MPMWVWPSSPQKGGRRHWLQPACAEIRYWRRGRPVALFIRPALSSAHVIIAPLQEFPRTAPGLRLRPLEHPLRRAALWLIYILVPLQVVRRHQQQRVVVVDVSGVIVVPAPFSCNSARRKIHRFRRLRHLLARPDPSAFKTAASSNRSVYTISVAWELYQALSPPPLPFSRRPAEAKTGSPGCSVFLGLDTRSRQTSIPSCRKHRLINYLVGYPLRDRQDNLDKCLFPAKIRNPHLIED
jgi:hypothetical protein